MPAEAGIHLVRDGTNFKDLDPRFRAGDGVFPLRHSLSREKEYFLIFGEIIKNRLFQFL
jgi:hypothetical protein